MVEGYPYGLGGWGVPAIFREGGRLFGRYIGLLSPFIFAFLLPTALIQLLELFGLAWWASGQSPFIPPGPHPHSFASKISVGVDGYNPPPPPPVTERTILIMFAVGILMWLLASLAVASICKAVEYIYAEQEENPFVIKSIFSSLPGALFRLFVTSIWVFLLTLATIITVSLPFYLLALVFKQAPILALLQQVFLSVSLTILGFMFLLSQEVAVLEPAHYGLSALKKSAKLVQEKFLPALTLFALTIVVGGLLSRLSTFIGASYFDSGKLPLWAVYVLAVIFAVLYLVFLVYVLLVTVVLYFSSKLKYDAEEGSLPEFLHSSNENPYAPLVVPAEN
jgi:hypothetical protein